MSCGKIKPIYLVYVHNKDFKTLEFLSNGLCLCYSGASGRWLKKKTQKNLPGN